MGFETPSHLEGIKNEVENEPNPKYTLSDLRKIAENIDASDEDPIYQEMVDDLADSSQRYLNSVLSHEQAMTRARLDQDERTRDREVTADRTRRRTHDGLISKFESLVRRLGDNEPDIRKWYSNHLYHKQDEVKRRNIGLWALREALQQLEKHEVSQA